MTSIVNLVTAIAKKRDIDEARQPEPEELPGDRRPGKVMDVMEKHGEDSTGKKENN